MSSIAPAAVFDAVIFLQAMINDQGPAFECWRLVVDGKLTLYVSPAVLEETEEVANRPVLQQKFKNLTPDAIKAFPRDVRTKAVHVSAVPNVYSLPRDPNDEPYINLAIATTAQYLVTRDKDLLELMTDESFCGQFPSLTILDPVFLLRDLGVQREPKSQPDETSL